MSSVNKISKNEKLKNYRIFGNELEYMREVLDDDAHKQAEFWINWLSNFNSLIEVFKVHA